MGALTSPDALGPRPSRPLAVLLSLICFGGGQLYCGFPKRALVLFSAVMISSLAMSLGLQHATNSLLLDGIAVAVPFLLAFLSCWDAYRCAGRSAARKTSPGYVLVFILLTWFVPDLISSERIGSQSLAVRSYYIQSGNMLPTIRKGDYVLVRATPFQAKRGDVVVFEPPDTYHGNNEQLVSRIVALGGDEVEVKAGVLWLNGAKQNESYTMEPVREDFQPFRVPEGQFFVMGDNRNDSYDSRYWHGVPADHLRGRVSGAYYSKDSGPRFISL